MKRNIQQLKLTLGRLDQRRVQLGLAIIALILFVLGAGAPNDPGCC